MQSSVLQREREKEECALEGNGDALHLTRAGDAALCGGGGHHHPAAQIKHTRSVLCARQHHPSRLQTLSVCNWTECRRAERERG